MVNNSFNSNEAKEYLKDKLSLPDQVKNHLYLFFKHDLLALIQSKIDRVSNQTSISTNQSILDIDWDINIVAGGKGISKLYKRVANIKICSQVNKAAVEGDNEIEFEIDTESGNDMMRKLEELERVFNL
mmetsp:Transcript_15258/g.16984  ORF Transcript_15258/g.16984 Transcript_15258/m.16984 type:complete len:129 (-) Transcript_15258:15-401(-)